MILGYVRAYFRPLLDFGLLGGVLFGQILDETLNELIVMDYDLYSVSPKRLQNLHSIQRNILKNQTSNIQSPEKTSNNKRKQLYRLETPI